MQHTPKEHDDYAAASATYTSLDEMVRRINQGKAGQEHMNFMVDIKKSIRNLPVC